MAIDTRAKRFSILGFGRVWKSPVLTPDGSFDQADRQHLLHGYSGILWGAAASVIGKVCVSITGIAPTLTIEGSGSNINITGIAPDIAITGEGC